jgi:UDP-glucuronate 4-epimerase
MGRGPTMRCLVTGAAGFIGSHLSERLIDEGHEVTGLDAFLPYYPRAIKERNLAGLRERSAFHFYELDLRTATLNPYLAGVDTVFHLAAMPGLTASWTDFDQYMTCNLLGTKRLLEAARDTAVQKFVHASTSSVYGRDALGDEGTLPRPISPYGVTKLAAEQLALAHQDVFGIPVVVLRYFSVYGPRQRPDMGYNIFIGRMLRGEPIVVFGDGEQTRGNTYISDCVEATVLAAQHGQVSEIYNIGGGEAQSLNWVVATLEGLTGVPAHIEHQPPRPGDQAHTMADIRKARRDLGYAPRTPLREGLAAQVAWHRSVG